MNADSTMYLAAAFAACPRVAWDVESAGLDWTGLDWTGLDWTGLDWTGLDWTGAMIGLGRATLHARGLTVESTWPT